MNNKAGYFPQFGLGTWWIELTTLRPSCTYYFGPFHSYHEAELQTTGYIEDLAQEGAEDIITLVKCCNPTELTIFDETESLMLQH